MPTQSDALSLLTTGVGLTFENIKFADNKAAILLALNTSIAGAAYSVGTLKGGVTNWTAVGILGFSLMTFAVAACIWVMIPRPRAYLAGKGLFHPQQVTL